ncbi:MAG TPA: 5-formyltetrahydrofolate cyclo-ligase [Actinocrinis sp.]|nr:5-formyltetrahydrofolate cyclo-ligase [Actinocrinis sp.]
MPDPANDKATKRSRFVNNRFTLGDHPRSEASAALARRLLAAPELAAAGVVCAYQALGAEPDPGALLDHLAARGVRVLLPILLPDGDLDWAERAGDLVRGRLGLLEPAGPRLGPAMVGRADCVLLPALAVSAAGARLGRGGGSYDRALARTPAPVWTCALVYDHELDADFPVEPHDQPVRAACSPSRLVRFRD